MLTWDKILYTLNFNLNALKMKDLKQFLYEFSIFFLLLITGMYLIDLFITENLKKYPKGELGVWNQIYAGNINAEILVYGASRAQVHFDPRIIQGSLGMATYNLGINGHNFWLQYLRHKTYLKYNTTPKIILMEVGSITLDKRKDLHDPDQFLPYMLNNSLVENATSTYDGYKFLDYHVPLFRYYGKIEQLMRAVVLSIRPYYFTPDRVLGYEAINQDWNSEVWEKNKKNRAPSNNSIDPQSVKLFETFLNECKTLGIRIILVASPEFYEGQHYVTNRKEIFTIFELMSSKYNIPFLDYSNDSISYKTEYFYNSQHLNNYGSDLFTRNLVVELKRIIKSTD